MKKKTLSWATLATGILVGGLANSGHAQSVDALLNKLVDKGVLSTKEAEDLKKETDKNFTKAYKAKSGMPDWVNSLKFGGDFRGRYDGFYSDETVDRNRFRYRLRFGAVANLTDNFDVGLRLASSEPANGGGVNGTAGGNPVSGNTTMGDNASRKWVYLDLAYAKWTGLKFDNFSGSLTFGKMESPFVYSSMLFDADYNPEGLAGTLAYHIGDHHTLKLAGGGFSVREISTSSYDSFLLGSQIRLDSTWADPFSTSIGVGIATVTTPANLANTAIPNQNFGNTRRPVVSGTTTNFVPAVNFNPIFADVSATYNLKEFPGYTGAFPIKVFAEYMVNPAAPRRNKAWQGGIGLGKSGKKGLWELNYAWRYQGADSWFEEFVEDDFGAFYPTGPIGGTSGFAGGTNVKGHIIKAAYSPYDALTLSVTYYRTELIDQTSGGAAASTRKTDLSRIMVDATLKF